MKIVNPSFEILPEICLLPTLPNEGYNRNILKQIEQRGRICYKSEDKITEDSCFQFFDKMRVHGHNSVLEMAVVTIEVKSPDRSAISVIFHEFKTCKYINTSVINEILYVTGSIRAFLEIKDTNLTNCIINYVKSLAKIEPKEIRSAWEYKCEQFYNHDLFRNLNIWTQEEYEFHRHIAVKFIVNRAVSHEIVRHRASLLQESQRYCRYSEDKFGNEVSFIKPLFFEEGSNEYLLWETAMVETEKIYLKLLETSSPQAARTVLPNSCKTELILYYNLTGWKHIFKLRTGSPAEPSMREVMIPLQDEFIKKGFING